MVISCLKKKFLIRFVSINEGEAQVLYITITYRRTFLRYTTSQFRADLLQTCYSVAQVVNTYTFKNQIDPKGVKRAQETVHVPIHCYEI